MSLSRIKTTNADRLVYRQRRSFVWPMIALTVGISGLFGTAEQLIEVWPQDALGYGGGIVLCLALVLWAIARTATYEFVLDRMLRQAFATVRWPWKQTRKTFDLANAVEVRRHVFRPIECPDLHWVSLAVGPDRQEMKLFNDAPFGELRADEADRIAQEIGEHLQLPVVCYADGIPVTQSSDCSGKQSANRESQA